MSVFTFKQFIIYQDFSAHKVGTDSVLLGSWAKCNEAKRILDIGTGTGLLSLQCAQRNASAEIIAIELDELAIKDASKNFAESIWKERIQLVTDDVKVFALNTNDTFDYIISNPPYFDTTPYEVKESRARARHLQSFTLSEFFKICTILLNENGILGLVFPFDKVSLLKEIGKKNNLFPVRIKYVKSFEDSTPIRVLIEFEKKMNETSVESDLVIYEDKVTKSYTEMYKSMTNEFYVKF